MEINSNNNKKKKYDLQNADKGTQLLAPSKLPTTNRRLGSSIDPEAVGRLRLMLTSSTSVPKYPKSSRANLHCRDISHPTVFFCSAQAAASWRPNGHILQRQLLVAVAVRSVRCNPQPSVCTASQHTLIHEALSTVSLCAAPMPSVLASAEDSSKNSLRDKAMAS